MTIIEAQTAIAPFLTTVNANEYNAQDTDQLVWIEYNIFDEAGVNVSINTEFGEALADWVETKFMEILS